MRLRRLLVTAVLAGAALLLALPWLWHEWTLRPVRALRPGDERSVALEHLGAPDVRLPLSADGLDECWTYFWPADAVRSLCKRLPWKPSGSAFGLDERPEVMVQLYWNADGTLRDALVEPTVSR